MKKVKGNKDVFEQFSKLKVGVLYAEKVNNSAKLEESQKLLKEMEGLIRLTFRKETLKNHDLISPWAVAQARFGKKAKHYHTSVERLMKQVLRRKTVTTKDTITNLVRYISLKNIIPFGIDDYDLIQGDLTFAVSTGKERAGLLKTLKPNALYYHDEKRILGTKLDYWKSSKTKLENGSIKALIHIEALPPIDGKKLDKVLDELKSLIKSFCGGKVKTFIIDKKKKEVKV